MELLWSLLGFAILNIKMNSFVSEFYKRTRNPLYVKKHMAIAVFLQDNGNCVR